MEQGRPFNMDVVKLILRTALNWYCIPVKKQELIDNGFYSHNNQERNFCFQHGWIIEGQLNVDGLLEDFVTLSDSGMDALRYLYPDEIDQFNQLQRQNINNPIIARHWYLLIQDVNYDIVSKKVTMSYVKAIDSVTGQQTVTSDPNEAMHFRSSGSCKPYVEKYGFDVQKYSSLGGVN